MRQPHCRTLLVEDDPNDQLLFEIAFKELQSQGTLHCVIDGAEAVRYLRGEGLYADRRRFPFPTMVVTDLKMGAHHGLELLNQIRRGGWAIIPLIVLSSSDDPDDVLQAYAAGCNTYFVKPSDPKLLRQLVQRLHDYWKEAEVPDVDPEGHALPTNSAGKLSTP